MKHFYTDHGLSGMWLISLYKICILRTYMVLKELNIPFEVTEVSGRPKPDWYLRINPRGKVPAIRIPQLNNQVIYESAICCEYLCDAAVQQTLMPNDPMQRAIIRLLNDHCDTMFTKTQFTYLMNNDIEKDKELVTAMEDALLMYEEQLEKSGGPFLMGEHFTLSDIHVLPFILRLVVSLKHFKNYELLSDKFPKFLAWYELCSKRESVMAAALTGKFTYMLSLLIIFHCVCLCKYHIL